LKGISFVAAASLLWAIDTLIRYPLLGEGVTAERIVFSEHLFLLLFFVPVFISRWNTFKKLELVHIFYFSMIGGLGSALGTIAFTKAFTLLNPTLVILLQKLQPLVAIVLARLILNEPIKKGFILWAIICLIGGILISANDIFNLSASDLRSFIIVNKKAIIGYFLALVAVVSWGSGTVFGKKMGNCGFRPVEIMASRYFFGTLFLIPFVNSTFFEVSKNGIHIFGKISLMAIISGVIAMFLYYQGLKRIPARVCSLAEMFFPFFAVIINWVFLNASLTLIQIVGGCLLLLGSTVIQLKRY
jgi:drug/metabolite transporter (DMT)-like permease